MVGNPVKFIYVATGGSIPAEYRDNPDTIYFLEATKQIKVGTHELANVDDTAVSVDELAEVLDAYKVKRVSITGSGDTINVASFDAANGILTLTKGAFPSLSKGAAPVPYTETLDPGGTFEVVTGTSVSDHTITDNTKKFTLPTYVGTQGVDVDGVNISLPTEFYNYLVQQTFATPTITTFAITGLGNAAEIGTSVTISEFSHRETNIDNIQGDLTLKQGSTTLMSGVVPASTASTVTLGTSRTVTRTTEGTETFTLSGVDKLGGTLSKSVSKTFYVPKFSGSDPDPSITSSEVLAMNKGQSIPTTVTNSETAYIYFITDKTVSSVKDADTGFGVPIESPVTLSVTINSVPVSYKVYRTSDRILAGTYHFTIA